MNPAIKNLLDAKLELHDAIENMNSEQLKSVAAFARDLKAENSPKAVTPKVHKIAMELATRKSNRTTLRLAAYLIAGCMVENLKQSVKDSPDLYPAGLTKEELYHSTRDWLNSEGVREGYLSPQSARYINGAMVREVCAEVHGWYVAGRQDLLDAVTHPRYYRRSVMGVAQ